MIYFDWIRITGIKYGSFKGQNWLKLKEIYSTSHYSMPGHLLIAGTDPEINQEWWLGFKSKASILVIAAFKTLIMSFI